MKSTSALFPTVLIAVALAACSKSPSTPADQMAAADKASMAGDHAAALDLYQGLVDWKGEGSVSEGERFKASLESVKALFALERPDDAVKQLDAMYGSFKEMDGENSYRHMLAAMEALSQSRVDPDARGKALEKLVVLADAHHPSHKDKFKQRVKDMMAQGLGSDAMAKLKQMGYL